MNMPDTARSLWSGLTSDQRVERMMTVIQEASMNSTFRAACLDEKTRRETIENKAQVTLDTISEIRCYPDKKTTETELVLRLPEIALPPGAEVVDYWLCTYIDYRKPSSSIP